MRKTIGLCLCFMGFVAKGSDTSKQIIADCLSDIISQIEKNPKEQAVDGDQQGNTFSNKGFDADF